MNNNITDMILELMYKYEWLTASIARYVVEHNIDLDYYVEC